MRRHDSELEAAESVVGEHTFSGQLYSPDKARSVMNIDVATKEDTHTIPTVEQIEAWIAKKNRESRVKEAEKSWHTHTDSVAVVAGSGEALYESRSLVSHAAWFHKSVTGDLKTHEAFHAASTHDAFTVEWNADYETGTLHVTVEKQ